MNAARKPRVSEVVFDSSVLIAILQREPFDPIVLDLLEDAVLSTVNLAEVISKQVARKLTRVFMIMFPISAEMPRRLRAMFSTP